MFRKFGDREKMCWQTVRDVLDTLEKAECTIEEAKLVLSVAAEATETTIVHSLWRPTVE